MSYILDALKKVEREKGKKALPGGMSSIAGDLFLGQPAPPVRGGGWKVAALIVIAILVTFSGTWLLLRGVGDKGGLAARPVTPVSRSTAPMPSAAPVAIPVTPAPLQVPPPVLPSASSAPAPPAAASELADPHDDPQPSDRIMNRSRSHHRTPPAVKPPQAGIQAPADIRLSGIAWQDDRSARRAVINGFLLKEGAVVAGYTVAEIRADKVNFSSAAGNFEIRLNAVVPAEGKP